MAINFEKFDKSIDLEGLKNDIGAASNGGNGEFKEVPHDDYIVEITKLELSVSKKGDPMFVCWMKILEGEYEGSLIFMNQVVTQGFQIHIVNKFLRALTEDLDDIDITFESYSQYNSLILDVAEKIFDEREYLVKYGENKGFNTFDIKEYYDAE